jgi:two-component system chemotaxis response regulator CheY
MKVLIADDDPTSLALLEKLLSRVIACTVTTVTDGEAAIKHLEKESFSLLFLDVHMPILGGLEALEWIRRSVDPTVRDVPVVMLTGDRNAEVVQQAAALGILAYLVKPLHMGLARTRLRSLIRSLGATAP